MYCTNCEEVRVCAAIPVTELGKPSGQRWYRTSHPDVQFFRRGRECLECGEQFLTAEVQEDFLNELAELRDALAEIRSGASRFVAASSESRDALDAVTMAMQRLRALG